MPLVYGALESENPVVLERALRAVPGLSETLDYTVRAFGIFVGLVRSLVIPTQTVKQILFPKITTVFTKTTLLSVKVK